MKTSYKYLLLFTLLGLVTGCHKEEIEDPLPDQQPIFTAQGTIGSESFSAKAGEEGFYMSTFSELVNGVDLFSGKLSNGDFELQMGIYDGNIDLPASSTIDNLPSSLQFAQLPTEPLATLSKNLLPNNSLIQEIKWYINGVFAGLNSVEITNPGKYTVCADVTFFDQSHGDLCNDMILGYTKNATCKVRHLLSQNGSLQTWIEEDLVPLSSVKWFMDGILVSEDLKLMTSVDSFNHKITAEVIFANGVKRTKSILIDGGLNGKFIDDFSVFEVGSNPLFWDFKALISLKKDGKQYSSNIASNQSSTVNIIDVTYYGINSSGKAVFKITAEISCLLKEIGTGTIVPFTCNTVFALEIN